MEEDPAYFDAPFFNYSAETASVSKYRKWYSFTCC